MKTNTGKGEKTMPVDVTIIQIGNMRQVVSASIYDIINHIESVSVKELTLKRAEGVWICTYSCYV